jgi:hypothetical protein
MKTEDIKVGRRYLSASSPRWRQVRAIRPNGSVEYVVQGIVTILPLLQPIEDFAAWARDELQEV